MTPPISMTALQDRVDLGAWKGINQGRRRKGSLVDRLNENARIGLRDVELGKVTIDYFTGWLTQVAQAWGVDVGPQALAFLAYRYHCDGNLDKAASYYGKALILDPQNYSYRLNLAGVLGEAEKAHEAEALFDALLRENPADEKALNGKGNVEASRSDLDAAEKCYLKALEIEPAYRIARLNLGFLFLKKGQIDHGLKIFESLLKESPGDTQALMGEADAFFCKGDLDLSLSLYERVMELDGKEVNAVINYAIVMSAKEQTEKAVALLEMKNRTLMSDRINQLLETFRHNISSSTDLTRHFDTVLVDVPGNVDVSDWQSFSSFLLDGGIE